MVSSNEKIRAADRYMPCLLSRLVDKNPEKKTDAGFSRGVSVKTLKREILRNIEMILNSASHPSRRELGDDPLVCTSVLALGLPDFCGVSHGAESRERLRSEILRQVRLFEPRIRPESLEVVVSDAKDAAGTSVLDAEIRGLIEVSPLREELVFRSRFDLETGTVAVSLPEA